MAFKHIPYLNSSSSAAEADKDSYDYFISVSKYGQNLVIAQTLSHVVKKVQKSRKGSIRKVKKSTLLDIKQEKFVLNKFDMEDIIKIIQIKEG